MHAAVQAVPGTQQGSNPTLLPENIPSKFASTKGLAIVVVLQGLHVSQVVSPGLLALSYSMESVAA